MKIRSKRMVPQANKIFTDREEPRKSFWDCYQELKAELPEAENIHVLAYYGIGGIGKTSLVKQLMRELTEQEKKPYYVYHDLDVSNDTRSVLESIRNKLAKEYGFVFPRFDLALYYYAIKCGENINPKEVKTLIEKSKFLGEIFQDSDLGSFLEKALETAELIPGVDLVVKVAKFADKAVAHFRQYRENKQIQRELKKISFDEPAQILAKLPECFAQDLTDNLDGMRTPLVIFLDTYEQLVNELSSVGDPTARDIWLRGEEGLIQNIPGILWVITGREKLKWEKYDVDWQEALEQHILGSLSIYDAENFLASAGIGQEKLRQEIYGLTNGTPVYLDLCVDTYYHLLERGEEPRIELFGGTPQKLIERFIRYMDDSKKDMVYLLAVMGSWNDAMMDKIGRQALPGYSLTAYEHAKELSFVTCDEEGNYSLHKTVEEVLRKECPRVVYEKALAATHEYYQDYLAQEAVTSSDYAVKLKKYCEFVLTRCGVEECKKCYKETIRDYVWKMAEYCQWEEAEEVVNLFWEAKDIAEDRKMQIYLFIDLGKVYKEAGKYDKAYEYNKKAYQNSSELYGEDHPNTLTVMHNLANSYSGIGEYTNALEVREKVLAKSKEILGETHPATVSAMLNLALSYGDIGEYAKALELREEVLAKRKEILGEDHPDTLSAMHNLANSYSNIGEYTKAIELREEVLAKRKEILGEDHPDTLSAMHNLANSYSNIGEYTKAIELREEVLAKRKEILGEDHPDTLDAMGNLANGYGYIGEYTKAIELREEVLAKRKEILGESHRNTLIAMHNLAISYKDMEEYTKALKLWKEASVKSKEILGENDTSALTLNMMKGLAVCYSCVEDYNNAIEAWKELLLKYNDIYGKDHLDTLDAMYNLANSYSDIGEYTRALELQEDVLTKRKEILGKSHPDTLDAMDNLACSYYNMREYTKALDLFKEVLAKRKELLGKSHPNTLSAMQNLAVSYGKIGEYAKELELKEEVLAKRKEILGEDHPDTLTAYNNLAWTHYLMNQCDDDLLHMMEGVVRKQAELLGQKAGDTLNSMDTLAKIYGALGQAQKQEELERQIEELKK